MRKALGLPMRRQLRLGYAQHLKHGRSPAVSKTHRKRGALPHIRRQSRKLSTVACDANHGGLSLAAVSFCQLRPRLKNDVMRRHAALIFVLFGLSISLVFSAAA